jgi:hypothetical protein
MTRRKRSFNPNDDDEPNIRRSNVIGQDNTQEDDDEKTEILELSSANESTSAENSESNECEDDIEDEDTGEDTDEDDYEDQMDDEMAERIYLNSDGEEFTAEQVDQLPSASASESNSLSNSAYFPPLIPHWSEIFTQNEMQNIAQTMTDITAEISAEIMNASNDLNTSPVIDLTLLFPSNMQSSSTGPLGFNLSIDTLPNLTINTNRFPMTSRRRRIMRRHFTQESIPMSTFTFTDDEYQMATHYFNGLLWNEDNAMVVASINVLHVILEYWEINERNAMPTFEEIVELILSEVTNAIEINTPMDEVRSIIASWLENYGCTPALVDIDHIYEYYLLHHDYPTQEQLDEIVIRTLRFYTNPEAYHQEDKIHVPALNVDKILKVENQENDLVCSICQEEIEQKQLMIKLPPCNHAFHASPQQCLDGLSIFTWLGQHNMCPLCKTKVEVK